VSLQSVAASLLLPPLLFIFVALAGVLIVRRRWVGGLVVAASMVALLLLATPFAAGHLRASLQHHATGVSAPEGQQPGAIVILGAEVARLTDGTLAPGPLTLERLHAGALLARRTRLPVLVTGGPLAPGDPPLASVMAGTMRESFGIDPRWVEPEARDTAENARNAARMLGDEGIGTAHVVTHAWHMRRSLEAFARTPLVALPSPVRLDRTPEGRVTDWVPRPDHLAESWFMIREWVGLLVYRVRDGRGPGRQ
jgi:uncharacterized SAM-binding protein YcdF (DUF218 family)